MTNNLPNKPRVVAEGSNYDIVEEDVKPVVEEAVEPSKVVETDYVEIASADNRDLEVSVGNVHFVGKKIAVPRNMEKDIKRILEEGGFFIKS